VDLSAFAAKGVADLILNRLVRMIYTTKTQEQKFLGQWDL